MAIGLLLWNAQNRELMEHALAGEFDVLPQVTDVFSTAALDLLIVDGPALAISRQRIVDLKRRTEPALLPVLFVSGRPDVQRTTTDLWQIVDDVVTRPIVKRELIGRIRSMLHGRRLSLGLQRSFEAQRRINDELRRTRALYEEAHEIAETLQHAVLPKRLPEIPGFRLDAYYEPSRIDSLVGGDWFDALCVSDGRLVVSIGDVAGSGLEAAVTMGSVRQAIRAVAQIYPDPLTMLDAADRMLKEEQPDRIVTAFVGVIDPVTKQFAYASAGHPPPLLRLPDGSIDELRAQSLPLGLRMRGDTAAGVVPLPDGAFLALFTDGLSEARRDTADAERRLRAALDDPRVRESPHPAAAIKEAVYDSLPHSDDVAILVVDVGPARREGVERWRFEAQDGDAAARARTAFVDLLRRTGSSEEALFRSELIFGELIGNVVRYAPGEVEVVAVADRFGAVLHVLDRGKGFTLVPRLPSDLLSERGRGLYLVWALSSDFNVDQRPGGGAHARAVLPVAAGKPALEPLLLYPD